MVSDYSYVKLCMINLMIDNSGGVEVALSCRQFIIYLLFTLFIIFLEKFSTHLILFIFIFDLF